MRTAFRVAGFVAVVASVMCALVSEYDKAAYLMASAVFLFLPDEERKP